MRMKIARPMLQSEECSQARFVIECAALYAGSFCRRVCVLDAFKFVPCRLLLVYLLLNLCGEIHGQVSLHFVLKKSSIHERHSRMKNENNFRCTKNHIYRDVFYESFHLIYLHRNEADNTFSTRN